MKVKRLIHKGWKEWNIEMPKKFRKTSIFGKDGWVGKYQYIFLSKKGEISLIKLKVGGMTQDTQFWMWEIMEMSANNLFENVEKFNTKKQAEKRIKELLE